MSKPFIKLQGEEFINWEIMGPILDEENKILRKELEKLQSKFNEVVKDNIEVKNQLQTLSDICD